MVWTFALLDLVRNSRAGCIGVSPSLKKDTSKNITCNHRCAELTAKASRPSKPIWGAYMYTCSLHVLFSSTTCCLTRVLINLDQLKISSFIFVRVIFISHPEVKSSHLFNRWVLDFVSTNWDTRNVGKQVVMLGVSKTCRKLVRLLNFHVQKLYPSWMVRIAFLKAVPEGRRPQHSQNTHDVWI